MEIGTFARTNEQVEHAIQFEPDFIDLRMDLEHSLEFGKVKKMLSDAGISSTLHMPSDPDWKPMDLARDIVPYIDIGADIGAELVTFHSTLSSLLYPDRAIDEFLESVPLACDAAQEAGVQLAVENLGLYYTELMLLFEKCPKVMLCMDIGHGQIMAQRNRTLAMVESFPERIAMVNIHDNSGDKMAEEVLELKKKKAVSKENIRELSLKYDSHLPIGTGTIDFNPIFRQLKESNYDGKFLMMAKEPDIFSEERENFMKLWLEA